MPHGFYPATFDYDLPHESVRPRVFLVLESAIRAAWEELLRVRPDAFHPVSAKENEITRHLWALLANNYLPSGTMPGFNKNVFADVSRGPEVPNYNGRYPDKKPDLVVKFNYHRPRVQAAYDGIFIEAKLVDAKKKVPGNYFKEGIRRYVRGDYAWAMRESLILGYTHGETNIAAWLTKAAEPRYRTERIGEVKVCSQSKTSAYCLPVHITVHRRTYIYPETGKEAPVITLRHMWLIRPDPQLELVL